MKWIIDIDYIPLGGNAMIFLRTRKGLVKVPPSPPEEKKATDKVVRHRPVEVKPETAVGG